MPVRCRPARRRAAHHRALTGLARKRVGLRYAMNVVPTDPRWVRGSHGRLPDSAEHGPVLLSTDPFPDGIVGPGDRIPATRVRDLVLGLQGLTGQASRKRSTE